MRTGHSILTSWVLAVSLTGTPLQHSTHGSRGDRQPSPGVPLSLQIRAEPPSGRRGPQRRESRAKGRAVPWIAPIAADGHVDLQGVWMNDSATPLERPKQLEGRALLTDLEVAELQRRADRIFGSDDSDAGLGDNVFLAALADLDRYTSIDATSGALAVDRRVFDNRTSLIVDPADGRLPSYTPRGQARVDALRHARADPPDDPESLPNYERCLTDEVPRLVGGNRSFVSIVQTPDYVILTNEFIHEARVIPLRGTPHLANDIRFWSGDSRGHWEKQTLVVDTINFTSLNNYLGSDENLHIVERFTRSGPLSIDYEITLDDPTVWTRSWTAMVHWKQTTSQIYEDACHEGNYSVVDSLRGARAQEKP